MSTLYHCNQLPTTSGIYRIRCVPTDKFYIGSAINLRKRWGEHRSNLSRNLHPNSKLQNAWNKHTEAAFIFEIIELVLIPEMLVPREQHWIDTLKPIFNIAPKAGSRLGTKASPEFGANITKRQLGRKLSDDTRKKIGDAQRGIPRPERRGEKHTPEHIEKHRRALTGYKHTEETKRKMGDAHLGSKRDPETREKIRLAALGHAPTNAKTFIVTAPDGTEYTVHNLSAFCKEHGLASSTLIQVARGNRKHHKKWTAKYPDPTES